MVCHLLPFAKVGQNSPLQSCDAMGFERVRYWKLLLRYCVYKQ